MLVRILRHYVPVSLFALVAIEAFIFFFAIYFGIAIRFGVHPTPSLIPESGRVHRGDARHPDRLRTL